ncbi:sigma-70 family RNA polymerase sigma factor [Isoptericola sp. NEAU-Y5]|uniref:Sigma-70 family RNA polymerase sigma factor n=1 Tax=Isoptericola luteus TaxID=2879484 RepID=A0ABS7ZIX8_9MICO|nr:sigma-70 family RNA polymerase sigma factor [Isoptericola sp. NEAU-Y5]MCA5894276.1 sigma-70 family RNA polymerase sigma factor [Isoptericola sp. NEAU-Y5]
MSIPDEVSPRARLAALWDDHAVRVQAYALRHTDPDTAQDVVSETFLVAWRRIADVPDPALPWLLVVARNHVRTARRSARRRRVLTDELTLLEASSPLPDGAPESLAAERDVLLRGLARLTAREREAILLVAWDGLAPAEAADVADCTTAAFHVRLHRARRRLASAADVGTAPAAGRPSRPATSARRSA